MTAYDEETEQLAKVLADVRGWKWDNLGDPARRRFRGEANKILPALEAMGYRKVSTSELGLIDENKGAKLLQEFAESLAPLRQEVNNRVLNLIRNSAIEEARHIKKGLREGS